jgi:hypothetical protein
MIENHTVRSSMQVICALAMFGDVPGIPAVRVDILPDSTRRSPDLILPALAGARILCALIFILSERVGDKVEISTCGVVPKLV